MPELLSMEFRSARDDRSFVEHYLRKILRPGIDDPVDSGGLFNADAKFLSTASAIIGLGRVEQNLAAGLYITQNQDAGIAWLNGVLVVKPFRGRGFGRSIVSAACTFISTTQPGIQRIALTIRCDDSGRPREAAFNTYKRQGFVSVRIFEVVISGLPVDRHFGPIGSRVLSMLMEKSL